MRFEYGRRENRPDTAVEHTLALRRGVGTACIAAGLAVVVWVFSTQPLSAQVAPPPPIPLTPPRPIGSLKTVSVPEPPDLLQYVQDKAAAVQLGKALFWDVQVGSDGATACATCHFNAGADNRTRNILNPGPDGAFQLHGPNTTLTADDFPLHKLADINNAASAVLSDANDIVGAQGVFNRTFTATAPSGAADPSVDSCTEVPDPVYHVGSSDVRRVTGRHVPSAINAVFNFRNFWDGRANNVFNGVDPFGPRNTNARVWKLVGGSVQPTQIAIQNASLASQATGPGLSPTEMSCAGRIWPNVGHKLFALVPLGKQRVDPSDSVLGLLANSRAKADAPGLQVSYVDLIKKAFRPEFWSSTDTLNIGGSQFSQMEADFSLFWGLAVEAYESTLVSDDSPVDQYFDGKRSALTAQQVDGLGVFTGKSHCDGCHGGAELTNASVANVTSQRLERMLMGDDGCAVYDNGFYNIGVRPTAEDPGVGGSDPFGNPLSETRMALLGKFVDVGLLPALGKVPECDGRSAVDGAFKVPGLRNVELIGPYFHNGGKATLRQVVDFYNRGGDFATQNIANLDADIKPLHLTDDQKNSLVAFLVGLTDERVRWQRAPFDHPALCVPNGEVGDATHVTPGAISGEAADNVLCLAAVGASGASVPLQPFLGPNPLQPINQPPTTTTTPPNTTGGSGATTTTNPPSGTTTTTTTPSTTTAPAAGTTTTSTTTTTPATTTAPATGTTTTTPSSTVAVTTSHTSSPARPRATAPAPAPAVLAPPTAGAAPPVTLVAPPPLPPLAPPVPVEVAPPVTAETIQQPAAADAAPLDASPVSPEAPLTPPSALPSTITAVMDAATGGVLSTLDGALTIEVPAGQPDTLTLTLTEISPLSDEPSNLQVGGRCFVLTIQDTSWASVSTFDPALVMTFRPNHSLLASGNFDALVVLAMNPDTGALEQLATSVATDTLLTTSVAALGSTSDVGAPPTPASATSDPDADWTTGPTDPVAQNQ